jgi:predicted extracellular nuclease
MSVVISQVYGGGGNSGATFTNDFIELFNRGSTTIDLSGWSVQYAGAGAASWAKTALSGTLAPGHYYLIQEAAGSGGTQQLPTPDATGSINMAATAGKVALVNNNVALNAVCPSGNGIVDFVGYGGSASCFEGTAPAPAPGNTTAAARKEAGCADSNDNAADFGASAPQPRNSATPISHCAFVVQTETGAAPSEGMLPFFSLSASSAGFSARRPRLGLTHWRRAFSAYVPPETPDAPPRPRGASP